MVQVGNQTVIMNFKKVVLNRWKSILTWFTILALLFVMYTTRHQILITLRNLTNVNAYALLLLIPIELLNYHAQTKLYQKLFQIVGNKFKYGELYKISLELNFVNHVFPSAGVTGLSYFGLRLRNGKKLTGGKATLIQVIKLGLILISFEILIVFGIISLSFGGHVNDVSILVASTLSTLLLVLTAFFVYIVGSRSRINNFFINSTKVINKIIQLVRKSNPETININKAKNVFDDFHDAYVAIKENPKQLRSPFVYALLANLTEVMALYAVYMAFDSFINPGAVILAYAVANFAGLISVLPGGIGVYEALMTIVLVAVGVPAKISLPVTIMYRVLNTLLQIPPGYIFYQMSVNRLSNNKSVLD